MADVLRVTVARRDGKPFPKARVSVEPSGAAPNFREADAAGQVLVPLPATGENTKLDLIVTHPAPAASLATAPAWHLNDTAYWPVTMPFVHAGKSHAILTGSNHPQLTRFTFVNTSSGLLQDFEVRLFRVRRIDDVAHSVLKTINVDYPFTVGGTDPPNLVGTYSTTPLLDASDVAQNIVRPRPKMDRRAASLYEVAARKDDKGNEEKPFAPKLVGAWIPLQVLRDIKKPPPPSILIYFRPQANQDFTGNPPSGYPPPVPDTVNAVNFQLNRYDPDPYSKAQYYLDWFFRKSFEYVADPWQPGRQFAMGFRNQIKAAGKRLGVVAPIPEAGASGATHGHAVEPDFMAELVQEIVGLADVEVDPGSFTGAARPAPLPGRMAVCAHSNGNDVMSLFISNLGKAAATNLVKQQLREIYLLDPAGGGEPLAFDNCAAYAATLPAADAPALRCYAQNTFIGTRFPDLHQALLRANHPPQPYDDTSERLPAGTTLKGLQHRTAAFLPKAAWPHPPPGPGSPFNDIHSFIPSTMLAHALLLSAFPDL